MTTQELIIEQSYKNPPNNYPLSRHRTHGLSQNTSWAQVLSTILIITEIITYFVCIHHIYENIAILILYVISGTIGIICACLSIFFNPTDKIVYYYKSTRIDKSTTFQSNYKQLRYCSYCDSYCHKTSKHCRQCNRYFLRQLQNRCVPKFDHHCIWFNNCVGNGNYAYFFVSITALFIHLVLFVVQLIIATVVEANKNFITESLGYFVVAWLFGVVLVVFDILLLNLIGLHIYLMYHGITTYEFLSREKKASDKFQQLNKQNQKRLLTSLNNGQKVNTKHNLQMQKTQHKKPSYQLIHTTKKSLLPSLSSLPQAKNNKIYPQNQSSLEPQLKDNNFSNNNNNDLYEINGMMMENNNIIEKEKVEGVNIIDDSKQNNNYENIFNSNSNTNNNSIGQDNNQNSYTHLNGQIVNIRQKKYDEFNQKNKDLKGQEGGKENNNEIVLTQQESSSLRILIAKDKFDGPKDNQQEFKRRKNNKTNAKMSQNVIQKQNHNQLDNDILFLESRMNKIPTHTHNQQASSNEEYQSDSKSGQKTIKSHYQVKINKEKQKHQQDHIKQNQNQNDLAPREEYDMRDQILANVHESQKSYNNLLKQKSQKTIKKKCRTKTFVAYTKDQNQFMNEQNKNLERQSHSPILRKYFQQNRSLKLLMNVHTQDEPQAYSPRKLPANFNKKLKYFKNEQNQTKSKEQNFFFSENEQEKKSNHLKQEIKRVKQKTIQ